MATSVEGTLVVEEGGSLFDPLTIFEQVTISLDITVFA